MATYSNYSIKKTYNDYSIIIPAKKMYSKVQSGKADTAYCKHFGNQRSWKSISARQPLAPCDYENRYVTLMAQLRTSRQLRQDTHGCLSCFPSSI